MSELEVDILSLQIILTLIKKLLRIQDITINIFVIMFHVKQNYC